LTEELVDEVEVEGYPIVPVLCGRLDYTGVRKYIRWACN